MSQVCVLTHSPYNVHHWLMAGVTKIQWGIGLQSQMKSDWRGGGKWAELVWRYAFGLFLWGFYSHLFKSICKIKTLMLDERSWLKIFVLIHPRGDWWGWGHDFVRAGQVLPHQTHSAMSFVHGQTEKALFSLSWKQTILHHTYGKGAKTKI